MSKILVFSDLHIHPFRQYSSIDENGLNSRLKDGLSILDQVYEYAKEYKVSAILFGGDLFHVRKQINVAAFNGCFKRIEKLSTLNIPIVIIPGNHDQMSRDGDEHSVFVFNSLPNIQVIDTPQWVSIAKVDICAIPYTEDFSCLKKLCWEKKKGHKVLLGHMGVQGAKVGADFVYASKFDPKVTDLNPEEFNVGFLGHYHLPQHLGYNFQYVGAPLQHNWSDTGQDRGIIVYDTDTCKIERINNLYTPKFVELDWQELKKKEKSPTRQINNNFVRIINVDEDCTKSIKEEIWEDMQPQHISYIESSINKLVDTSRLEITPQMTLGDITKLYIKNKLGSNSELDMSYLEQIAKEVLEEVNK